MNPSATSSLQTKFHPDQQWLDNNGVHINAHGGGVLFHQGVYYWFGEHKTLVEEAEVGVHVYSSTDLYNWKDRASPCRFPDDKLEKTVSLTTSQRLGQETVFHYEWKEDGPHTIKIVKKSGQYLYLDGFQVTRRSVKESMP